ncbi:MAG: hypothetical protein V1921_02925 [Candidatus Altiarchaeota archaeon]
MGVTRLETDRAVYLLDHEKHDSDFTLEAGPERFDVFVAEPYLNLKQNDVRQTSDPENRTIHQLFKVAEKHGKDVWLVGAPSTRDYDDQRMWDEFEGNVPLFGEEGSSHILGGIGVSLLGAAGLEASRRRHSRRIFLLSSAGLAAGVSLLGYGTYMASAPAVTVMSRSELKEKTAKLVDPHEIPFDDANRISVAEDRILRNSPFCDGRDAVDALKIRRLVGPLAAELGRKPTLYIAYGATHTGILDYLADEKRLVNAAEGWSGRIGKYLQRDWFDLVTRWHNTGEGWQPEVFRVRVPELVKPERLSEDSIREDFRLSRRAMLSGNFRRREVV